MAQPYIYPQAFVQPSLVLPTQVSSSVSTSPYLDYSTAYSQYAQAAFEQQYPYAASPAGFLGYSYATSPSATAGPAAAATAPATVHPSLPSAAGPAQAFLHYAPQQHIQPDRMQWEEKEVDKEVCRWRRRREERVRTFRKEDGKTPYRVTQLLSAGAFRKKGWDYCTIRSGWAVCSLVKGWHWGREVGGLSWFRLGS